MTQQVMARIELALEDVRPHLEVDKGSVEVVRFEESTGVLELRFLGSCKTCSMSALTLRAGIERVVRLAVPEVRRVESVT